MNVEIAQAVSGQTSVGFLGAAVASRSQAQQTSEPPPGAPPAFGTAPPVGPEVSPSTFAEAEKLMQVELTAAERAKLPGTGAVPWHRSMSDVPGHAKWRSSRRSLPIRAGIRFCPGQTCWPTTRSIYPEQARSRATSVARRRHRLRSGDSPGAWIENRQLSFRAADRNLSRALEKFDPKLRCVITLTSELALAQARKADQEIASGKYRGPLHGIPWGGKDLLDTAGIATTYGAEPFRNRVPTADATVVKRLHDAGAVLVAKLSLGALALNDIWFGGQTMNPWLLEEGASGSSAGPGAATAAGLVGFAIGSETGGSIVAPSMRCGITGLRPTYGRVPRTGAMTLCWSLDKLGPMTRSVEDAMLVLHAISGPDAGDLSSVPSKLDFDASAPVKGLRVGYFPAWMKTSPATEVDRAALETVKKVGMVPVEVTIPDWPYDCLNVILFAESAAAFEDLTLSHRSTS